MCLTILGGHCHFDFLVHGNHLSPLSPGFLNSIAAHAASLKRMRKWQWVCDKWGFSTLSSMLCLPGFITIFLFTLDCAEHFMNIKQSFGSYVTSSLIRWGFKMWVHLQTRSIIFVYPSTFGFLHYPRGFNAAACIFKSWGISCSLSQFLSVWAFQHVDGEGIAFKSETILWVKCCRTLVKTCRAYTERKLYLLGVEWRRKLMWAKKVKSLNPQ